MRILAATWLIAGGCSFDHGSFPESPQTDAGHNPFVFVFPWRAANAAWEGRGDDARAELATWRESVYPTMPGFIGWYASTWAARGAWWSNDAETAELLYDGLLPFRGLWAYAAGAALGPVGSCGRRRRQALALVDERPEDPAARGKGASPPARRPASHARRDDAFA